MTRIFISALLACTACDQLFNLQEIDTSIDGKGIDTTPLQFSSCISLAATCGPSASDDCCATATTIPGGTFYRSYDVATDGMFPNMSYPATVSDFVLDKYEVTVGRFRAFVNAGMGTQASPPTPGTGERTLNGIANQGGWDANWNSGLAIDKDALIAAVKCTATTTWTDTPGANENLPMNCIKWYEAMAFCAWDGGFLPTEAEWNYAASGGSEQRAYPWSNPAGSTTIDCSYANYLINVPNGTSCATSAPNHVGSESPKGDGKWGQSDLGGNVWEWVLDWYASSYPATCNDCANLTSSPSSGPVIRGADFGNTAGQLRTSYRTMGATYSRSFHVGFRCARP